MRFFSLQCFCGYFFEIFLSSIFFRFSRKSGQLGQHTNLDFLILELLIKIIKCTGKLEWPFEDLIFTVLTIRVPKERDALEYQGMT